MRFVVGLLLVLFLALQYQLWVSEDGLGELRRLSRSIQQQRQENAALVERNQVLDAEVRDLKSGLDALEERARSELGMVKQGETFFQIIEEP
ncbi:Septum formation initiator [Nitrosococcus halophilus Nc 4]|uniref:Cell division protein FtsB n=1 Tax=Nitrosococcus halophilus (strain Nc4) TaxID=472759 RepID=D5BX73_NITHN|nr:cell division protein FtsB [Nitrosococcus halophilus]ADE15756.1 Septum formation initiator [Nitrosococcus halophilus Nc 4]